MPISSAFLQRTYLGAELGAIGPMDDASEADKAAKAQRKVRARDRRRYKQYSSSQVGCIH